jgi:polyisoprenyl-teichoic acid--peptidoglycan teichoic acid transferase
MPSSAKPYRRFRARGRGPGEGGLEELRALTSARTAGAARGRRPSPRPDPVERPQARPASRRPPAPPRRARPAPPAADGAAPRRRIWSLRGIGVLGWTWRIGVVLLVALLAWGGFGYWALSNADNVANSRVTPAGRRALAPAGGLLGTPQNILVIGSDARGGEHRARADTIMIMRTDPDAGRIRYLSIPRDFRVDLPRMGPQKINAALFFYGQPGIIGAVRRLTGLPIHHIIVIRFQGLARLVDDLGGVTVDNPTALVDCPYPGGIRVSFPKGPVHLDGARALQYVRVRKCDSDLQRAARQQLLVSALKGRVVSLGSLYRAPWRAASIVRAIGTDLSTTELVKLGWLQARLKQVPADRMVLAGVPQTIGGISYVVGLPDQDEQQLGRFVGDG